MIEALVALGFGRDFFRRQQGVELKCDERRIFHLILCGAGMNRNAVNGDMRARRIEILVFQLAERTAVHRVGVIRAEARDIEMVGAAPDLLVRRECDPDFAVRHAGGEDLFDGGHDFRDSRLVVRADQRRAVRDDELLSRVIREIRIIGYARHDVFLFVQDDIAAGIIDDPCLDVFVGRFGRGIHMRDKADGIHRPFRVGRKGSVYIAITVDARVRKSERVQLAAERLGELQLLFRARHRFAVAVRHGGISGIF